MDDIVIKVSRKIDDSINRWNGSAKNHDLLYVVKLEAAEVATKLAVEVLNKVFEYQLDREKTVKLYSDLFESNEKIRSAIRSEDPTKNYNLIY